jgi:hypothetical protein
MKLIDEGIDFEFRGLQQKGHPVRTPDVETRDLVNLAREILDSTRAVDEEGGSRRFKGKSGMATMDQQNASTSAKADSPTSRFTAVNGNESTPARRGSDERANGQPRISPPGQEKLTITTTTQRQDWAVPANSERPYPPTAFADSESTHKRKRSASLENNSSSANSYHSHALPSATTKETPTTAGTEPELSREDGLKGQPSQSQPQSEARDSYHLESDYRRYLAVAEESREMAWAQQQSYPNRHVNSDEHLGEVLRSASQNMDTHRHHEYQQDSPGDGDRSADPYPYTSDRQRELSELLDPKKRKRNFSNRTKTGCMTCRKRKKKCDETRPECTSN